MSKTTFPGMPLTENIKNRTAPVEPRPPMRGVPVSHYLNEDDLFILRYMRSGAIHFKLCRFNHTQTIGEAIVKAKEWCKQHSFTFIFLEPAIEVIS